MTHGSLFSGIGGFDLAAEWMGWENKFHCEWNEFGQRVLHYYWPEAELFTDITKSDFKKYANTIDVLTGGFPCQPYSAAGKRLGKEDERHLWPEMLRAIREIAPRYVVGENVRGLTNWNGGMVFDEVCSDLENLGYQVALYLIPACAVNAPHRRERIWFVAYANGTTKEHNGRTNEGTTSKVWRENKGDVSREFCSTGNASDTDSLRLQQRENSREMGRGQIEICKTRSQFTNAIETNGTNANASDSYSSSSQCRDSQTSQEREKQSRRIESFSQHTSWEVFPTQPPICGGNDGLPTKLDRITFPKWRNESIKAYGNAVVPQVVYEIFKAIESYERIR